MYLRRPKSLPGDSVLYAFDSINKPKYIEKEVCQFFDKGGNT
jgi:hypothetical protein